MKDILVVGLGGAGCSIVSQIKMEMGSRSIAINTDRDALQLLDAQSFSETQLIGPIACDGLPAGAPEVGRRAAEESLTELTSLLAGARLLIMVAGLGGGTGSGALPTIVKIAQSHNIEILVAATLPFGFEGARRQFAFATLSELKEAGVKVQSYDLDTCDKSSSALEVFDVAKQELEKMIVTWVQQAKVLNLHKS